jgi:hypothetical protein
MLSACERVGGDAATVPPPHVEQGCVQMRSSVSILELLPAACVPAKLGSYQTWCNHYIIQKTAHSQPCHHITANENQDAVEHGSGRVRWDVQVSMQCSLLSLLDMSEVTLAFSVIS